jgi:hypothetical protein
LPETPFAHHAFRNRLAVMCLCALTLSSCMMNKKTADAAPDAQQPEAGQPAGPALANGGTTASTRYVDPLVSAGHGRRQAQAHVPQTAVPGALGTSPESGFPPAPQQPASISGLVTQPTGVRAGSVSIYSSAPPASADSPPNTGSVPGNGPINATTGSMFTPRQPLPPTSCGNDAKGNPLTC